MNLALAARIGRRELRGGLGGFSVFLLCLMLGVAAIAAIGTTLALPGLGLVVAGPIAAAIAGAGAGAAGGGLIGALIGWNMPEERVKEYEEGVKSGGILMGVHARSDDDAVYLEDQWRQNRGERVYR